MRLTWIGHSTVLVELDGVRLLTDPVLRPRVLHLKRVATPAEALASVDAVFISHAHYDHLDLPSLRRLGRGVPVFVPRGLGALLRRRGFTRVIELDRDEETTIGPLLIRATHAEHESARRLTATAPGIGFFVSGTASFYFAGDTDLFPGMDQLAPDLGVALLPIAGWGPKLPAGHLDPLAAARALALLRPRAAVPIHWGTYRRIGVRGDDDASLRAPADEFLRLAAEHAPDVDVRVLPVGGSVELPEPVASQRNGSGSGALA